MSFNDPARLLDCPNCNGQNWPEDDFCYHCKCNLKRLPSSDPVNETFQRPQGFNEDNTPVEYDGFYERIGQQKWEDM